MTAVTVTRVTAQACEIGDKEITILTFLSFSTLPVKLAGPAKRSGSFFVFMLPTPWPGRRMRVVVPRRIVAALMSPDDSTLLALLRRAGLAETDDVPAMTPLVGGVSSDILRVDLKRGPVCVKRALAKLKVEQDWRAPISRNAYEVAWMRTTATIVPGAAPAVLAHDAGAGLFVMQYLDPTDHPVWKQELRRGRCDIAAAAEVGRRLAAIHQATAGDNDIARRFNTDDIFYAIRLEPYLEATAQAHPAVATPLRELVRVTAATREALVHGDVSPKNIVLGPAGPVFLDAECAWYGDPAFDLAFCLNHLLLKCLWMSSAREGFLASYDSLAEAYLTGRGNAADPVEDRAARLLPGLLLARVDGKSPVEYVTDTVDKDLVRGVACQLLMRPVARLADVRDAWARALDGETES